MNDNIIKRKASVCNISSTLVCVALGCVSLVVIVATLTQLGVIGFGKQVLNKTKQQLQGVYDKSSQLYGKTSQWYSDKMNTITKKPQSWFGKKSQQQPIQQSLQQPVQQPVQQPLQQPIQQPLQLKQPFYNDQYEEVPRNETFNQFNSYGCMENFNNQDDEYESFQQGDGYESFQQGDGYEQNEYFEEQPYEGFEQYDDGYEYADTLQPAVSIDHKPQEPKRNKLKEDIRGLKKDVEEIKKKCPGMQIVEKKETFEGFGADDVYFDDGENFGNLTNSETKAFGDGVICQAGTPDEQNISNPIGSLQLEGGSRCKNASGTYDAIIGDMHPYYLNEIAANGDGNELIAASVRRHR